VFGFKKKSQAPNKSSPPTGHVKLIAIDIDGTLLRSDHTVHPVVAKAVRDVQQIGVRVVLASARPPQDMAAIHRHLGLDTFQINYNGALISASQGSSYNVLLHQPMSHRLAMKVIRRARNIDPGVQLRVDVVDKWYTDRSDTPVHSSPQVEYAPDGVGDIDKLVPDEVSRLIFLASAVNIHKIRQVINTRYGRFLTMPYCGDRLLQITHLKANKATALHRMAEHYGVDQQDVMAIGDAPNDISMLEWAGIGVGMVNGWMKTLEAADVLVASNDHGGVAEAIRLHVFGEFMDRGAGARTSRKKKAS
jgi:Cof subfamily protein (haloacid dehalogenase superfamily)